MFGAFTIGKKILRRTTKSLEYLKFASVKQNKFQDYNIACMIYNQHWNKSKSVAGDRPIDEGYVTELGQDNKTKDGIQQEKAK